MLATDAKTLENSEVGDITKLSLVLDHDIRCWIVVSSSILRSGLVTVVQKRSGARKCTCRAYE